MVEFISFISCAVLLAIGSTGLSPGNLILILGVVVAVILATGFLIVNRNKKKWAFKKHDLVQQIKKLKEEKGDLEKEVADLNEKLKLLEDKEIEWEKEREDRSGRIKELEDRIKQLSKKEEPGKKDVIIEYYMNDKT